jgi:hypothetical protein
MSFHQTHQVNRSTIYLKAANIAKTNMMIKRGQNSLILIPRNFSTIIIVINFRSTVIQNTTFNKCLLMAIFKIKLIKMISRITNNKIISLCIPLNQIHCKWQIFRLLYLNRYIPNNSCIKERPNIKLQHLFNLSRVLIFNRIMLIMKRINL